VNFASVQNIREWLPSSEARLQSMLAAPVLEGETLLGVITIFHSETAAFDSNHLDLLQTICQQVGLALSNAHRYQDVNRLASLLSVERSRLEGLLEMLPVGVLLLDDQFNLLVTNPLGREFLTDLAHQTAEDQPILKLGQYEISQLLEHHTDPLPLEITVDSPVHRVFEAQAQLIPADPSQWVITLRDVTQEREIQERVQMQERLATVGQLAAGIAHDFNNIMAAIVVYADLLLMDKSLSATSRERLVIIQQQVQRAASLIRQILDFSRRSVMEHNVFDLLPFLKEMEKLLKRTLPETITVSLHYQDGEYTVLADPTRLQQVFMNLAVNARDAMPDGGEIRFDLSRITLEPREVPPTPDMPTGHWVQIRISDTGSGIPIEAQPHIFEPFFTTKPVGKGTGLGLAQVYGIIKQHKGFIDFESQPGQGTRFNIYLPDHASTPDDRLPASASIEMDGRGKTVLLVEDDDATRKALEAMLKAHRYQVLVAQNGLEAISFLENEPLTIDLVVSDIVMPQMGGLELYEQIQNRWPQVQMLFITGHPLDERNQQLLQQGRIHWLQKPFTVQEFNQVVLELMG
jgi:signal transduction histidine kinase